MFRDLATAEVNVDMIVQNVSAAGVTDISFTVPHTDLPTAVSVSEKRIAASGATAVLSDDSIAKVSVIGAGMKSNPGVAATMFEVLARNEINIEMISTSAIRISCVIAEEAADRAVTVLHEAFELDRTTF